MSVAARISRSDIRLAPGMVTGPAVGEEGMNGDPAGAVVEIVVVAAKGRNVSAGGEPPASPLPGPGRRLPSTSRSDPFEVDGLSVTKSAIAPGTSVARIISGGRGCWSLDSEGRYRHVRRHVVGGRRRRGWFDPVASQRGGHRSVGSHLRLRGSHAGWWPLREPRQPNLQS